MNTCVSDAFVVGVVVHRSPGNSRYAAGVPQPGLLSGEPRSEQVGRRETQINVQASSELGVRPTIDSPASGSGRSDPDLNRLLSEIAHDRGAPGSESRVRYHVILKVTGTTGFPEHRDPRKAPPARELEETTAIMAGVIHLLPEKRNSRLRHVVAGCGCRADSRGVSVF